jgi:F-type H+-transporting ATPase subunit a
VGLHFHGCEFIKLFLPGGIPTVVGLILLPVEVLSYISRIVSLAVRLFANMVAGHCVLQIINIILLGTIYGFYFGAVFFASIALIIFFVMSFLEFSVAFLQAYVFLTLAIIYIESTLNIH